MGLPAVSRNIESKKMISGAEGLRWLQVGMVGGKRHVVGGVGNGVLWARLGLYHGMSLCFEYFRVICCGGKSPGTPETPWRELPDHHESRLEGRPRREPPTQALSIASAVHDSEACRA